jgi:hypothetical protein
MFIMSAIISKIHTNLLEATAVSLELDAVTSANSQPVLPSEVNPPAGAAVDAVSATTNEVNN